MAALKPWKSPGSRRFRSEDGRSQKGRIAAHRDMGGEKNSLARHTREPERDGTNYNGDNDYSGHRIDGAV